MEDKDKKKNPAIKKTVARLAMVQYIYSCYIESKTPNALDATKFVGLYYSNDIDIRKLKPCSKHFSKIFSYIELFKEQVEEKLNGILKRRSFESNDPLIKAILVVAGCEVLGDNKLPRKVMLNEYTNIASSFYDKEHVGFINASLECFADSLK